MSRPQPQTSALDRGAVARLDTAWRFALRHYSTLFLLVALFTVPLHLAYNFYFRDVAAVRDLHADIARFPESRRVHKVGPRKLRKSRTVATAVAAFELALIPVLVRAARRVAEVDRSGGVPTVADSLRGRAGRLARTQGWLVVVGPSILLAAALAVGLEHLGSVLVEPVDRDVVWAPLGLVEGISRAAAAPFFLASWVFTDAR